MSDEKENPPEDQQTPHLEIKTADLHNEISKWQKELQYSLSIRIQTVLDELKNNCLTDQKATISIFELIVQTIFECDKAPAQCIADLLVPLNPDTIYNLDDDTLSQSAALLRDSLKKDFILYLIDERTKSLDH